MLFLTVSRHIQLYEVLEVLDVGRQVMYLIVTQAELPQPLQSEEILKRERIGRVN